MTTNDRLRLRLLPYTVQAWSGEARVTDDIEGLSIEAAREIARAHSLAGLTARIMAEGADYCEVYAPDGLRTGSLTQTARVWTA